MFFLCLFWSHATLATALSAEKSPLVLVSRGEEIIGDDAFSDGPKSQEKRWKDVGPLPAWPRRTNKKPKINFMMDTNYPPYAMWNTSLGQPDQAAGFGIDFAREVCDACDLECYFTVDKWDKCWSNDLPGDGLMNGHFHACMTYTNQYQRQWSLEFSHGILEKNKPAGLLSRLEGGQPVIPPTSDLSGFKICDVSGWAPTIKTLAFSQNDCTNQSLFKGYTVVVPPENGPDAAMKLLLAGECDAVYMYADMIETRKPSMCNGCNWDATLYEGLGTQYAWIHTGVNEHMANGTTLAMTKKGTGVAEFLNPCIQKVIESKAYVDICKKYNLEGECFPNKYFGEDKEKHAYAMDNNERGNYCSMQNNSAHIHNDCGCSSGYCGCSLSGHGYL